jgi:hypothetical protein
MPPRGIYSDVTLPYPTYQLQRLAQLLLFICMLDVLLGVASSVLSCLLQQLSKKSTDLSHNHEMTHLCVREKVMQARQRSVRPLQVLLYTSPLPPSHLDPCD